LGEIEHLPIGDNTADVIISNCVINLSPEKAQVYRETFQVLKPGGRLAVLEDGACLVLKHRSLLGLVAPRIVLLSYEVEGFHCLASGGFFQRRFGVWSAAEKGFVVGRCGVGERQRFFLEEKQGHSCQNH